jgi:hypothetical protein
MKVVATQRGYYGSKVREPGEAFEISDAKHFSKAWMGKTPGKALKAPEPTSEPEPTGPGMEVLPDYVKPAES